MAYDSGALLYVRDTSLVAQPFDLETRAAGPAVTIAEDIDTRGALGSAYSVSRTGTLVYLPSTVQGVSRLVWMIRYDEHMGVRELEPREQKRDAQGGWGRGRALAVPVPHDAPAAAGGEEVPAHRRLSPCAIRSS